MEALPASAFQGDGRAQRPLVPGGAPPHRSVDADARPRVGLPWWLIRIVRSATQAAGPPPPRTASSTIKHAASRYLCTPTASAAARPSGSSPRCARSLRFKFNDRRARGWWRWYMTSFDDSLEERCARTRRRTTSRRVGGEAPAVGYLTWASLLSRASSCFAAGSGSSGSGGGGFRSSGGSTTKVCGTDETSSDSACSSRCGGRQRRRADGGRRIAVAAAVCVLVALQALAPTSEEEVAGERREGRPERWRRGASPPTPSAASQRSKNARRSWSRAGLYGGWPPVERADDSTRLRHAVSVGAARGGRAVEPLLLLRRPTRNGRTRGSWRISRAHVP